jgi:outer membrane translocation and assembly module TamA
MGTAAYGGGPQMRGISLNDAGGVPSLDLEPRLQRVYASVEARFAMTEPNLGAPA